MGLFTIMAKTFEEIIEVMGDSLNNDIKSQNVVIYEIFCGFNQLKTKVVFSGLVKDIPEELKNNRYTTARFDEETNSHQIEYTNQASFEGKKTISAVTNLKNPIVPSYYHKTNRPLLKVTTLSKI